ncbi:Putative mucin-like protein [Phytophthora palmivora]|uniref:Mucin-like protein n=1 Tax=Phytophthora palmivora TaxID=4796 RepID=A0A2P4YJY8_9STRA|nr:Putative mucin-like protein [Phytophthora palmivora]
MKTSAIATFAALVATAAANNSTTAPAAGCWEVSVEHDATYCIDGPICSGSGLEPTGSRCPVKGDVATADCHDYLASYSNGNCALPVDATCQVIKTGAWGCVLSSGGSASGEAGGDAGEGSGSVASNVTVLAAESEKSDDSISPSAVAAIAIGTGCVAAVAGFALYKQYQKHSAEAAERARLETFVDVVTP